MSFSSSINKICTFLGESNSPLIATVTISAFKGVLRPTFTMMDKKSDPDTKKYVATRECLTELVALGTYVVSNSLMSTLTKPLCSKTGITKKEDIAKVKTGLSVLSIWACAGLVIPMICNAILPPTMKLLFKKDKTQKDEKTLDIKEPPQQPPAPIYYHNPYPNKPEYAYYTNNVSMKVGGG